MVVVCGVELVGDFWMFLVLYECYVVCEVVGDEEVVVVVVFDVEEEFCLCLVGVVFYESFVCVVFVVIFFIWE